MQYFDKNGVEIKAGMTIRMEDGSLELVYDTTDSYGNPDLGINASNEEYLELHPFQKKLEEMYRDQVPKDVQEYVKAQNPGEEMDDDQNADPVSNAD